MKKGLLSLVLVAATVLGLTAPVSAAPKAASGSQPNIMFIMGDDIGWMQPVSYTHLDVYKRQDRHSARHRPAGLW